MSKSFKVNVEAHVAPWVTPEKVIFDEGLRLPVGVVDKEIIKRLCKQWLDDMCTKSGMTFEVVFDMMDEES